ncbi:hypothetical protein FHS59_002756 [Algoriphagus iocasae]|uniref:Uncharacterized protein n=1 Tax=Algoriphagus iocasae TaxID=1836499 RepID=A0A841MWZ7_9BACT|nr:hypothetical protein [Algoriphagus iocasae]MBB6327128.1 hypothetical protein [Algoriphagus iocasae]
MKTILFFWVFLLPLQIYAQAPIDNLLQERASLLSQLKKSYRSSFALVSDEMESNSSYANQVAMRIIEKDNAIIQKLQLNDRIDHSSIVSENEQYKTITLSQEQDIQKLKNALAQKGYEVNASQLEKRKFELATLIFFIGMITFGWLFVKDKLALEMPKITSLIPIFAEKE